MTDESKRELEREPQSWRLPRGAQARMRSRRSIPPRSTSTMMTTTTVMRMVSALDPPCLCATASRSTNATYPIPKLSADLTLANSRWTLAITDDTSRKKVRFNWTVKMPYEQIETACSQFITATQNGIRSLVAARWSKPIRGLVRSFAHILSIRVEDARPPALLAPSSFAVWNSKLTEASKRAGPIAAKRRLALGLPAFGPSRTTASGSGTHAGLGRKQAASIVLR
jgi:hypothetical protein